MNKFLVQRCVYVMNTLQWLFSVWFVSSFFRPLIVTTCNSFSAPHFSDHFLLCSAFPHSMPNSAKHNMWCSYARHARLKHFTRCGVLWPYGVASSRHCLHYFLMDIEWSILPCSFVWCCGSSCERWFIFCKFGVKCQLMNVLGSSCLESSAS